MLRGERKSLFFSFIFHSRKCYYFSTAHEGNENSVQKNTKIILFFFLYFFWFSEKKIFYLLFPSSILKNLFFFPWRKFFLCSRRKHPSTTDTSVSLRDVCIYTKKKIFPFSLFFFSSFLNFFFFFGREIIFKEQYFWLNI